MKFEKTLSKSAVFTFACILSMMLMGSMLYGCGGGSSNSSATQSSSSESSSQASESVAASSSASEVSSESASASSEDAAESGASVSAEAASADDFIAAINEAIAGEISTSEGEAITGVSLDGKNLVVNVDMGSSYDGQQGAGDLTMAQLVAETRFSGITDAILEMDEYNDLWETVTVDFGKDGSISKKQSEAVDSEYGRYFDVQDSDIA